MISLVERIVEVAPETCKKLKWTRLKNGPCKMLQGYWMEQRNDRNRADQAWDVQGS